MCAQRRLICPVWSESSLSAWRKFASLATHWAHSEDSDKTWRMTRLIRVFAGRTCQFVGVNTCVRTAKVLARLRGCAGSPKPSLAAYVISITISWLAQLLLYAILKKLFAVPLPCIFWFAWLVENVFVFFFFFCFFFITFSPFITG